jgi:hypothetical protein
MLHGLQSERCQIGIELDLGEARDAEDLQTAHGPSLADRAHERRPLAGES